ncbi:MAG: histidinol-phosphatase [Clostridia bacterium]
MIQNLHAHTTFCDGKNTVEEMVLQAINLGLKSFGFSGHSPISIENDYCMTELTQYMAEINKIRKKYEEKCEVFMGIELEYLFPIDVSKFDYSISSVHIIQKNGYYLEIDNKKEIQIDDVKKYYNGDFLEYIRDYYDAVINASKTGDILGHFDLVTKFNRLNDLFDENSLEYREIAVKSLEKCIKNGIIIEINTGAISRGYIDRFYPAPYLLDILKEANAKIIITTDAHSTDGINCFYDKSIQILKKYGFKKQMYLTKSGFDEMNL